MQFQGIFKHPMVVPLALAFLLLNLAVTEYGGTNAKSRNAALRAMSESHTFSITRYKDWTIDWAQTPDGRYFSNKAPGPMLLGFPLYWVLEKISEPMEHGWRDEYGRRKEPAYWFHLIFIFLLQVIPFIAVTGYSASFLANKGASRYAILYALLAIFFGNTADMFMNSNFGHGFAAMLELGLLMTLLSRRYFWSGVLASFAVLSDYGMIIQLPALAIALGLILWELPWLDRAKKIGNFLLGAIPGAILWCWYHFSSFGSIFALPNKFQNPVFVDKVDTWNLWGVITLPSPKIIYELVLGPSRGILVTQAWVLLLPLFLIAVLVREYRREHKLELTREEAAVWIYGFVGLLGLLLMNAGFNGWHGGHTPGPRYLSAIFPAIGVAAGLIYDRLNITEKMVLWVALALAITLRVLVYAQGILVPPEPIWNFLYNHFQDPQHIKTAILRTGIFAFVLAVAVAAALRRTKTFYALLSDSAS